MHAVSPSPHVPHARLQIKEIAQAVLFAFKSVAYNRPPALLPKVMTS